MVPFFFFFFFSLTGGTAHPDVRNSHPHPPLDQNAYLLFYSFPSTQIDVKVIGLNEQGKIRLSRKAVLMDDRGSLGEGGAAASRAPRRETNGARAAPPLASGGALGVVKRAPDVAAVAEGPVGAGGGGGRDTPGGGG